MSSSAQGILVTAGKVHTPFKTELLNTIAGERFAARAPHLVGILATKKEDARTYAEVRLAPLSLQKKHASKLESISN
jgi:hypothetical protein